MKSIKLYRPVGCKELKLIEESGMKGFPPRLEWQPIFYPVLNFEYAAQIAKDWNTKDEFSGYAGFVLSFDIDEEYFKTFEIQNVGSHNHNELWVPSEKLGEFNQHIVNQISVEKAFYGPLFKGDKNIN